MYHAKTAISQGQHFEKWLRVAEEMQPPVSNILFNLAWVKGWMLKGTIGDTYAVFLHLVQWANWVHKTSGWVVTLLSHFTCEAWVFQP